MVVGPQLNLTSTGTLPDAALDICWGLSLLFQSFMAWNHAGLIIISNE